MTKSELEYGLTNSLSFTSNDDKTNAQKRYVNISTRTKNLIDFYHFSELKIFIDFFDCSV